MGVKSFVKQVLTEQQNKKYARHLAAKTVPYDSWIREQEKNYAWKRDVDASQQLQQAGNVEFVCFVMPDGGLAAGALDRIAQCFAELPEACILYGDEDILERLKRAEGQEQSQSWETGVRRKPWFKPDWSPDLLNCSFYFGGMVAMRKSLWESVRTSFSLAEMGVEEAELKEGVNSYIHRIADASRFQTFIRRCVSEAGGYARSSKAVLHVPEMLYHGYSEKSRDYYKVGENIARTGTIDSVLSIIIPSRDNPEILEKCMRAIPAAAGGLSYEVIIVDNGSNEENRRKIEAMVQGDAVSYIYEPQEFHFSKMCNLGAATARGDLLLFLNDDVELAQAGSLEKMAELAVQEYTGAVGIKLYYPGSIKIQHAGITNLPMGPVHKLQFLEDDREYYFGYNRGCRNVLAVTAACLMVQKEKFKQVGGFAEELRVAFNDVDFCLQLFESGYFNVCRNDCFAYHHESLSRGDDESAEKLRRLLGELQVLFRRNQGMFARDPYYGEGLGREGLDTRIRPAYETAGNRIQQNKRALKVCNPADYRRDNCLLFRVEEESGAGILGYGVVLGDNNACYDRWLVFQSEEAGFCLKVEGQYRPDLVENMPDQRNVGLCGYWVRIGTDALPEGEYRIGMAVRNRVTGLKLINWSNRTMMVMYRTEK